MIRAFNLLVIILLIWFLIDSLQDRPSKVVTATEILGTERTPNYYSENLELRQFNKSGELQSLIKTSLLSHYSDQQHASLEAPELVLFGAEGEITKVTSVSGTIDDQSRNLQLTENVELRVLDNNNQQKINIKTSQLNYQAAEQTLWTDSKITADSAQGKFNADGLKMDVKSEQLALDQRVKIVYSDIGLDIRADQASTNLETALSRLQGNVALKHLGLSITGDIAEVQAATDRQQQLFVIDGKPAAFEQTSETSQMSSTAQQLLYTPAEERMELNKDVTFNQRTVDNFFEISADQLLMLLKSGQPDQLTATGVPVIFNHQLSGRTIKITAEKIAWDAKTQIAFLQQATLVDDETTFAADEIKYNTLTGEISATGKGNNRPSYRYVPDPQQDKDKETATTNDS